MDRKLVKRRGEYKWLVERAGKMHVDGVIFGSEQLINEMDDMVAKQVSNVASLPEIVAGSFAMPDAHWGYGFCIGGTKGTASYILSGTTQSEKLAFGSACHGAGRNMSRRAATKQYNGKSVINSLAHQGILIHSRFMRGVAEEAPGAYKDVSEVVEATSRVGLAKKVSKLKPLVCIKG